MKRISIFAAILVAVNVMAENGINWFSAIDNHAEYGSSSVTSVLAYEDSSVLIAGSFATCTEEPAAATFLNKEVVGAPFTPNMSQTNKNILVAKVQRNGEVVWMIHSDRGNGEAIAVPTADGGALVFATVTHTQKNALGDDFVLRLKNGEEELCSAKRESDGENSFQYGFVVRVTPDGKASIAAEVSNTGDEKNAFGVINWANDDEHYYLLLNDTAVITVNDQTITPKAGGSMVVLVFDEEGAYQRALLTKGQPVSSRSGQLVCLNNNLYVASVVDANDLQNIYLYRWSLTTEYEAMQIIPGAVDNKKNIIQVKAQYVDADGRFAYIVGGLNGGLTIGNDTLHQPSGKLVPFVVKYDWTEHKAVAGYVHESTGIGGASAIFERADTLYVYAYDWGSASGNRIRLEAMNTALQLQREIGLLNTKAMEVTKDGIMVGEDVIFNINTGKGATLSFVADPEVSLTTPVISGFVASVRVFTAPQPDGISNTQVVEPVHKQMHNGQIVIIRDKKQYTIIGQQL